MKVFPTSDGDFLGDASVVELSPTSKCDEGAESSRLCW